MPKQDLGNLRLACHDFSIRAAPALFSDLSITFRTNTFTKPSKLLALDRLGFYVKTLRFTLPHNQETFLPPLIEPETGAELSFTYTPQIQEHSSKRPKYGDAGTTQVLSRQYPALFHAATNVPAFIRAFSAFINLEHLAISCPGYDSSLRYRKSIVDYGLISLRIAIEMNSLNALHALTISPIHPGGLLSLSPIIGFGASPRSASRWGRIRTLVIVAESIPHTAGAQEPDQFKLLQTYLRNFQSRLEVLSFRWIGQKGELPVARPPIATTAFFGQHPANQVAASKALRPLNFPRLKHMEVHNVATGAATISGFVAAHKVTLKEIKFEGVELLQGTWDDALASMTKRSRRLPRNDIAEIPIMLSPSAGARSFPAPLERVEAEHYDADGQKSVRMAEWLSSKRKTTTVPRKLRDGLLGCEEQLRKVLRGSAFPWG